MKPYPFPLLALAAMSIFASTAAAEIKGLCNTGQTAQTLTGCTGVLVTPNPAGGGPNRDGNWGLAYPYPSTVSPTLGVCPLTDFFRAWVDSPNSAWLPDSSSTRSEWITPYDGEDLTPVGWYVYLTVFHVPAVLPNGVVPSDVDINGRLASDNATYGFFLASLANGGACALVTGLSTPINPSGHGVSDFSQWWDFRFTSPIPITPDSDVFLYVLVHNELSGTSPTGLRIEFFDTSTFY
jgi:hypothetical protein